MSHSRGVDLKETEEVFGSAERYCAPGIVLHIDMEEFDFYMTAAPGYRASDMRHMLTMAEKRGLALPAEEDREPELQNDGSVRLYLIPAPAVET
ncbi:hypothetical protein AB0B15_10730 [Streptomyces sp. NPDC045456]|uniref:hypothetical protein n=1 Tax=Streptomyces sp. NPDC045456 TaxID=3155254 RepID=UPI0033D83347